MPNAHIIGWGKYLPGKIVSNADLAQSAGVDADWVKMRTGIEERHIAAPDQATSDMAVHAAHAALKQAALKANQLNLIIVATSTPDHFFPATACLVQDALGAKDAAAFDLGAGCSGFLYALVAADRFIRSRAYRNALVIGVETTSRVIDWRDKNICAYFGDGAGAVVLTASDQPGGLLSFSLRADGSGRDLLIQPGGGSRHPLSQEVLDRGLHYGRMNGRSIFRFGARAMVKAAKDVLCDAKMKIAEVDLFIPHQTNATLIHQVAENLRLPRDKVFVNLAHYANISSAAIPVALCDAIEMGRVQSGNRLLITTFGGGLTSAGVVWQWPQVVPQQPKAKVPDTIYTTWARLKSVLDKHARK